ncbi:MAG: hypothetical protein LC659_08800 [Myxococcales bacterium]|nr:hypothetical protein [Myxococcales bacterium]
MRELIRRATVALQHASDAKTIEYQSRYADEARRSFDLALRSARARFEAADERSTAAARTIARHAIAFELEELQELETRLAAVEMRIAKAIAGQSDPRDFRRMRLAE